MSQRSDPIPMIMRRSARRVHRGPHAAHGPIQSDEDRVCDQGVTDVELPDLRKCGDRADAFDREPVTGMDLEAEPCAVLRGTPDPLQLVPDARVVARRGRLAVASRVQFDDRSAQGSCGLHDGRLRLDEQRDPDAGRAKARIRGPGDHGRRRCRGRPRWCAPRAFPAPGRPREVESTGRSRPSRRSQPSRN